MAWMDVLGDSNGLNAAFSNMPTIGNVPFNYSTSAGGSTYRGLFSDWFNNEGIAKEDWKMNESSGVNSLLRDLFYLDKQNQFNEREAQKNRDFQERMSRNAYQYVVEDLKKAGLNPILAYSNGGAATPQGSFATSGGARSSPANSGSYARADSNKLVGYMLMMAGGLMMKGNSVGPIGFGK